MKLWLALWLASTIAFAEPHKHGGPRDGRYLGVAVFESLGWKIPCQLDITVAQGAAEAEYERRHAFLKCLPGGPASRESFVQYYERVPYSFEKQTLQLIDTHNDLKASLVSKGDTLHGELRSVLGRVSGKLTLKLLSGDDEEPDPEEPGAEDPITGAFGEGDSQLPFLPALSGDWYGSCGAERGRLHVQTGKANGFNFTIGASLALESATCSVDGKPTWCWHAGFGRGQWKPFQATGANLRFTGPRQTLSCRADGREISCTLLGRGDGRTCRFQLPNSTPSEVSFSRRQNHAELTPAMREALSDVPLPTQVAGKFWGLLHHEALDRYQWVEMSVESFYDSDNPHRGYEVLKVAADATVYFGAKPGGDRAVARFDARPFQNTFPDFALSGGGDTLLRIIDWRRGYLRGVWYSKAHGRVGTLELVRAEKPYAVSGVKFVPALSGKYHGGHWSLDLQTLPELGGRLDIEGSTVSVAEAGISGPAIVRGHYDWFTGGLVVETDTYPITGRVDDEGLHLDWPVNPAAGGPLPLPTTMTKYRRGEGDSHD